MVSSFPRKVNNRRTSAGNYVSWLALNPVGRQGAPQNARRIQASGRRKVRQQFLYHQLGRQECLHISHPGVGNDRAQVGGASEFQCLETEASKAYQLLRTGSGLRQPRAFATAGSAAGIGRAERRGLGGGAFDIPRSTECRGPSRRGASAIYG